MVRLEQRHDVAAAGRGERDAQRQVDGLGARVHEEHGVERLGQHRREPLGELDDRAVVEPRVRVERAQLLRDGVREPRMPVAQRRDVVDHVEVHAPVGADQVLAPAALDARRGVVVVLLHLGEAAVASGDQGGGVGGRGASSGPGRCRMPRRTGSMPDAASARQGLAGRAAAPGRPSARAIRRRTRAARGAGPAARRPARGGSARGTRLPRRRARRAAASCVPWAGARSTSPSSSQPEAAVERHDESPRMRGEHRAGARARQPLGFGEPHVDPGRNGGRRRRRVDAARRQPRRQPGQHGGLGPPVDRGPGEVVVEPVVEPGAVVDGVGPDGDVEQVDGRRRRARGRARRCRRPERRRRRRPRARRR